MSNARHRLWLPMFVTGLALAAASPAAAQTCPAMRKINVGVSVSPPNVVHTAAYVAKELGIFAKHCIDATIIQFDGGSSPAASVALTQGSTFTSVNDAQFISQGTAGRLAGLVAGQIDGVSLHPEDAMLAMKQKPGLHILAQVVDLVPNYMFNGYGASTDLIAKDPALIRDLTVSMIEANRTIYREKDKVLPIITAATQKPPEAVAYAWEQLTKSCIWSVNTGFDRARTQWTINNDVMHGDIDAAKKPSVDDVIDEELAAEAVAAVGGPVTIGGCKD